MDIEDLKIIVENWAAENLLIKRAYIFGSRARDDWKPDSDLDIAIEVRSIEDINEFVTFICEKAELKSSLAKKIPDYIIDLKWHDQKDGTTKTTRNGIEESSILVYDEKNG